jgi:DNA polymerase III delta prime subunit
MLGNNGFEKLKGHRLIETANYPVILLYGPTGTGKTYTLCTATKVPELSPVCLIAIDRTDATLVGKKDIDLGNLALIDFREHMKKVKVESEWEAIKQVCAGVRDLKPFPFGMVILDGMSLMQYHAEGRAREQTPFHQGGSVLLELTQQGDYRLARGRMLPVVLDLVETCIANGAAFAMTAQERILTVTPEGEQDPTDDSKTYRFAPALMPSMIGDLTGTADIVGKMRTSGGKTILETRRTQYREAKDRYGVLAGSVTDPTMSEILSKLKSSGLNLGKIPAGIST